MALSTSGRASLARLGTFGSISGSQVALQLEKLSNATPERKKGVPWGMYKRQRRIVPLAKIELALSRKSRVETLLGFAG